MGSVLLPRSAAALAILAAASAHAQTEDKRIWAHLGPVAVRFSTDTQLTVGGAPVDGANASAKNNVSAAIELGYEVAPAVIMSMTVGYPPTTTLTGRGGPVDGLELGKVKYGPAVLSVHYHFDAGAIKPYLGAGVNYTAVLESKDGVVADLDVKSAWGSVLQAGVDVPLSGDWSLFLDVKKIFVKTKATGTVPAFGGPPAEANIRLNPLLIHTGISMRF